VKSVVQNFLTTDGTDEHRWEEDGMDAFIDELNRELVA